MGQKRLFTGIRLHGEPRYVCGGPEKYPVDVDPAVRKCVAYLGYRDSKGDEQIRGTCFYMSRKLPKVRLVYLVTVRHVIEQIAPRPVHVRLNTADGGKVFVELQNQWAMSDKDEIDVPISQAPFIQTEQLAVPFSILARDTAAEQVAPVELGDEVMVTGLFHQRPGTVRNVPIVRFGNVSALRDEPVRAQVHDQAHSRPYADIDAYLVETRSQGGLSGSPVFVYETLPVHMRRVMMPDEIYSPTVGRPVHLMGMIQGHFRFKDSAIGDPDEQHINVGISIVVPSQRIIEFFNEGEPLREAEKVLEAT